jgi:autotransporter translocation and assembly factor TamB
MEEQKSLSPTSSAMTISTGSSASEGKGPAILVVILLLVVVLLVVAISVLTHREGTRNVTAFMKALLPTF